MNVRNYFWYWGKARPYSDDDVPDCHLLPYHCLDVAAVMHAYVARHETYRRYLENSTGIGDESLPGWLAFWAALHDIGKFSEAFQSQRPDLFLRLRGRGPNPGKPYRLRHDSLGMLIWREILSASASDEAWFGRHTTSAINGIDCWARAATGHHGQPPEFASQWMQHCCKHEDRHAIIEFTAELRRLLLCDSGACFPEIFDPKNFWRASREVSWWFAGAVVLADWLGSNAEYFPYRTEPVPLDEYWEQARRQAETALDASGTLPVKQRSELAFGTLFPAISTPSPLQTWASTVPLAKSPQIHLLEDVTGAGKTEAAIILAHRLMSAGQVDGFFMGLPTMATANAMYGRIAQIYAVLFAGNASLVLAHGQRSFVEAFAGSVVPVGPLDENRATDEETASARCAAWLADHNKRALLAPAGVGTIDQALLSVLYGKHQSLRLLGLFRKVLIIDEVHVCDVYMQGILERLLEFHARAGGSAILLSATLSGRMKQALFEAFARGRRLEAPGLHTEPQTPYPLATHWPPVVGQTLEEPVSTRPDVRRRLAVRYVSDRSELLAHIENALQAGKCVCWMRNTVADAIGAYALFKGRIPDDRLTLFHARFALHDRLATEEKILGFFGKDSTPESRAGRLVVATQVAEQSLDADWDVVVSDLAPIDRLIQRAGRLQRHPRDEQGRRLPDPSGKDRRGPPCLWVFGPAWEDEPDAGWFKTAFPGAAAVYPRHGQLWLTARALRAGSFVMPDDARRLIEGVFGEEAEIPIGLQANANRAEGDGYADASAAAENMLRLDSGYERNGFDWWSEAKTPSRLGDASVSVVLARWENGRLSSWIPGKYGWAYSSVRVSERLISRSIAPQDPARKAAFDVALDSLPGKGKWSVLLALEKTDEGWIGEAGNGTDDQKGSRKLWSYSEELGLHEQKRRRDFSGVTPQKWGTSDLLVSAGIETRFSPMKWRTSWIMP